MAHNDVDLYTQAFKGQGKRVGGMRGYFQPLQNFGILSALDDGRFRSANVQSDDGAHVDQAAMRS
jgi:hypothetical protein